MALRALTATKTEISSSADRNASGWNLLIHPKQTTVRSRAMKLFPIAAFTILVGTRAGMAGAGAPVPEGSQNPPPSGRPSAPLDDAACQEGGKMAAPNGETASKDK